MRDLTKTNVRSDPLVAPVDAIASAEDRRRAHLGSTPLDAWRILNGPADQAPPGLSLDRYGDFLVMAAREHLGTPVIERWAQAAATALSPRGLVLKILAAQPGQGRSKLFWGEAPPSKLPIREADAVLLCDLDQGLSTGLFLDHRETRLGVRAFGAGREALNLFAYTSAFSVHAALSGALRVTSVDTSKRALRRGRENMAASGLDPDRHRWFPDDVTTHLARAARRGDRYGLVILDPPVVGRVSGRTFALERDLEVLLALSVAVVEPGGTLVVSVHATSIDALRIKNGVETAAAQRGRSVEVVAELGLPAWDHPTLAGASDPRDRGQYLKTLVLKVG